MDFVSHKSFKQEEEEEEEEEEEDRLSNDVSEYLPKTCFALRNFEKLLYKLLRVFLKLLH